jgi:hypothetical protein
VETLKALAIPKIRSKKYGLSLKEPSQSYWDLFRLVSVWISNVMIATTSLSSFRIDMSDDPNQTTTVFQSWNVIEVHHKRAILEGLGIPSFIADEHTTQWFWHYANAIGGAKLIVPASYAKTALEALEPPTDIEEKLCPQCSSSNLFYDQYHKSWSLLFSVFLGLLIPFYKNSWHCKACKHSWKTTDDTSNTPT